jgi:tetratricopeptide (TPR) repeat protein
MIEESQRQCDKALLIDDDNSRAWCQSARLFKIRGERGAAIGAYEKAAQADRTNGPAQYELALMYVDDGRHQMAIPYLEQVHRLGRDETKEGTVGQSSCYRNALHLLLLCYQKVGDPVKTEVTLKELRVFYPDSRDLEDHLQSLRQNSLSH